jgi:hypothetical protein
MKPVSLAEWHRALHRIQEWSLNPPPPGMRQVASGYASRVVATAPTVAWSLTAAGWVRQAGLA